MSSNFTPNLRIFSPCSLRDDGELVAALEVLEFAVSTVTAEAIIRRATEVPYVLEFILSGVPLEVLLHPVLCTK